MVFEQRAGILCRGGGEIEEPSSLVEGVPDGSALAFGGVKPVDSVGRAWTLDRSEAYGSE